MSAGDLTSFIQAKLCPGDNVIIYLETSLMQGWVRTSRTLALVGHQASCALFLLTSSRIPPLSPPDLQIERALPIDADFKCEIEREGKPEERTDFYVDITSNKLKLLFEMTSGVKTNNFVDELLRRMLEAHKATSVDFRWLLKYGDCEPAPELAPSGELLDSPDMSIRRESIARGTTPIAARESVIRYHMSQKEEQYTFTQALRVFVGSWNVNGQSPVVALSEWLAADVNPPDIYAVGFQELDLSKEAFLFNDTPREEEWLLAVTNGLHPGAKYHKVALVRLVGMMLIVFVQTHLSHHVKAVAVDTVGTGIMGKMGNKGAVSVRMEVHNTSMCFVNSHLAAHVEEFERRNQDYREICSRTLFSRFLPPKSIKDHDQIYWLGDLNYRITELDVKVVKDYLDCENYKPVLEYDQLIQQHRNRVVFDGFNEGPIKFRPTYKYDMGTDHWDSSEKNRAPAWCDRVLWKGNSIKQLDYRSHPSLRISDHKPVSSIFESKVRVIDSAKYRKIHEEVMKMLDKLENEFLPQVMVDTTEVIFDSVFFLEPQTKELIIANTGQVPVTFEFIKKLEDVNYCKDWLQIKPFMGRVTPGDKCDVELTVHVDKNSASKLNSGQDKLYDILVLHLEGGKDIFITVTGTYERSCFGCSLETLVKLKVPIKEVPLGKLVELETKKSLESGEKGSYPVPKEVWFLVDHLYRHGLKQGQLFEQAGLHPELVLIRRWLDNGSLDSLPGSVHSVAEALLILLASTPEPLIPFQLHSQALSVASNYLQCRQIILQLPHHSRNVFIYLCVFLQELLSHASNNGMDIKTIATVFGGVFIRDGPGKEGSWRSRASNMLDRKKANFVYHFLVNDLSDLMTFAMSSN